ncbi:MAG: cobalamin B12-binding domain-containing protein [Rhodospirillales bacterium]|nr:cobalamin B12-binding domain-containing protein [Rhodospirillales bacterium]
MTAGLNVLYVNVPSVPASEVRAHFGGTPSFNYLSMPTGLLYVAAQARAEGWVRTEHLLDLNAELFKYRSGRWAGPLQTSFECFQTTLAQTVSFTPAVIAFSISFTSSHDTFVESAAILRARWPHAIIVAGGHHATSCTFQLLDHSVVDYVVRGEGEQVFSQLLKGLATGAPITLPGVYTRANRPADPKDLRIGPFVDDLDTLPDPAWDLLDMEVYMTSGANKTKRLGQDGGALETRVVTFSSSRGCPFSCTFCASHQVHGRKMRYLSTARVIAMMDALRARYRANVFFPDDDLFTANKARTKELLGRFRETFPDCEIQAPGGLSVNTLDFELLDLFIATGTKVLTLAVESGSEHVQQYIIKKRCNLKKALGLVRYLRDRDVIVRCYFILGFPDESLEQMRETVDYAYELMPDWSGIAVAIPLPGSEIFDEFRALGVLNDDLSRWGSNFDALRDFDTPLARADEIRNLAYDANLYLNFFANPNLREGRYERAIELFRDIVAAHPFHVVGLYCIAECLEHTNRAQEAAAIRAHIVDLIHSDSRARQMHLRNQAKMPKIREQPAFPEPTP